MSSCCCMLPMAVARSCYGGVTKSQGEWAILGNFLSHWQCIVQQSIGDPYKTAESIERPFGVISGLGLRNSVLHDDPWRKSRNFGRKRAIANCTCSGTRTTGAGQTLNCKLLPAAKWEVYFRFWGWQQFPVIKGHNVDCLESIRKLKWKWNWEIDDIYWWKERHARYYTYYGNCESWRRNIHHWLWWMEVGKRS